MNLWSAPSSEEVTHTRKYSQDSLGKDLSAGDLDAIKNIVGGFGNTAFGTITSVASGAASVGSAVMTILDLTGVMPNKTSQTLTLLKEVADKLNEIQDLLNTQIAIMRDVQKQLYTSDLSAFDTNMANLNTLNMTISDFFSTAAEDKVLNVTAPAKPTGSEKPNDTEWQNYIKALVQAITAAERSGNTTYKGFSEAYRQLENTYRTVASQVTKTNDQNPMALYDKLCSLVFNFDTSAYNVRTAQRLNIQHNMEKAFGNIAIYYGYDTNNSLLKSARASLNSFEQLINTDTSNNKSVGKFAVVKDTSDKAYSYVLGINLKRSNNLMYGTFKPGYAFKNKNMDFSEDERNEFVSRMNGRTLDEEMALAGFTFTKDGTDGMAFYTWKKEDGAWSFWDVRNFRHYYAYEIKWNGRELKQVTLYYEWDDQNLTYVGRWTTA